MDKKKSLSEIQILCQKLRLDLINLVFAWQLSHVEKSLSVCEILSVLYFHEMSIDSPAAQRDRFILCEADTSAMLQVILSQSHYSDDIHLNSSDLTKTILQYTQSDIGQAEIQLNGTYLGLGVSFACGVALGRQLNQESGYTYALIGEDEMREGIIWEALSQAIEWNLNRFILIVDCNISSSEAGKMEKLQKKFQSFGCRTIFAEGHDCVQFSDVLQQAKRNQTSVNVILAATIRGQGVPFMSNPQFWDGGIMSTSNYEMARLELEGK